MKTFIFVNHRIRQKKPSGPVITAQIGDVILEGNSVEILHEGKVIARVLYDPMRKPSKTHHVSAFVETNTKVRVT